MGCVGFDRPVDGADVTRALLRWQQQCTQRQHAVLLPYGLCWGFHLSYHLCLGLSKGVDSLLTVMSRFCGAQSCVGWGQGSSVCRFASVHMLCSNPGGLGGALGCARDTFPVRGHASSSHNIRTIPFTLTPGEKNTGGVFCKGCVLCVQQRASHSCTCPGYGCSLGLLCLRWHGAVCS